MLQHRPVETGCWGKAVAALKCVCVCEALRFMKLNLVLLVHSENTLLDSLDFWTNHTKKRHLTIDCYDLRVEGQRTLLELDNEVISTESNILSHKRSQTSVENL